jgi:hypothetical protein
LEFIDRLGFSAFVTKKPAGFNQLQILRANVAEVRSFGPTAGPAVWVTTATVQLPAMKLSDRLDRSAGFALTNNFIHK